MRQVMRRPRTGCLIIYRKTENNAAGMRHRRIVCLIGHRNIGIFHASGNGAGLPPEYNFLPHFSLDFTPQDLYSNFGKKWRFFARAKSRKHCGARINRFQA